MCGLPLTFFPGSAYLDGVPMLQYSVPVFKATIDDVQVCLRCPLNLLVSESTRVTDFDL